MKYPNLFASRYQLQGRDWVRRLEPEDKRVFIDIGLQAADHGRAGGKALYMKHGREHMSKIGRIGAIMSNISQGIVKAARQENDL